MENLLNFSDWGNSLNENSLNEGKIADRVINSMSKTFGGKTSKMEKILNDIFVARREYVKDWEKAIKEIDKKEKDLAVLDKVNPKAPDDEEKIVSIKQTIRSLNDVIEKSEDKRDIKIRSLNSKGEEIYRGNARLKSYWNVRSSEYDVEIASLKHKIAKKLSNKKLQERIFGEFNSATEMLKKRARQLEENYGSLATGTSDSSKKLKTSGNKSFRNIVDMSDKDFRSFISGIGPEEMVSLKNYIRDEHRRLASDEKDLRARDKKESEANKGKNLTERQKEYRSVLKNIEKDINSYKNKAAILRNEK